MRFKLYYMVSWVKQVLEDRNGEDTQVPDEIQDAMELVMDFIMNRYTQPEEQHGQQ